MPNIKDVAERAGVSSATVSRVLANKPHVSERLRQRVMKAIDELNYRPDQTAQRLRAQNTSKLIGLIISGIHNAFFNAVIHGISDLAYTHNMNLLLCNAVGDTRRERYYLDLIRSERAAGVIVNPQDYHNDGRLLDELRSDGIAVIMIDTYVADHEFDFVGVDNRQGAQRAVQHLIDLGHRRIATIIGKMSVTTAQERLRGYLDALQAAAIPVDETLIAGGDYEQEAAYHATLRLLDQPQPPTALFVTNEPMTVGALDALQERGIRIPHDIAMVGFDDVPWMKYTNPPITTVAQPTYTVGREAVRLLMRRVNEPDSPCLMVRLPTKLVVRESCGAVPPPRQVRA
jgi:DNA-binding LacI/PurR family transcriptional regulator